MVLPGEVQLEQHLRDSEHFGSACQMAKSLCLMPCTGESSESSQRRPRRQRRRRQVVLPGEIRREQHLRDPKRRRADSRGQCSASAGIDDVATGLDDLAQASAEDWPDPAELLSEAPQVCCTCLVSCRILLGQKQLWSMPEASYLLRGCHTFGVHQRAQFPASSCLTASNDAQEESTARPLVATASQASADGPARRPARLAGGPSLPKRPGQRGPSLPTRRQTNKPSQTPQQSQATPHSSAQRQLPVQGDKSAPTGATACAPGTASAPAALLQLQLSPEQLSALQAIARDPALQAIALQPDKTLSEELFRMLLTQAVQQLPAQAQPTGQLQANRQPAGQPAHQLSANGQPSAQPFSAVQQVNPLPPSRRIHPPPIRKNKPTISETLRGRRTAAELASAMAQQQKSTAAGEQPLLTHRIQKANSKKRMVCSLS